MEIEIVCDQNQTRDFFIVDQEADGPADKKNFIQAFADRN